MKILEFNFTRGLSITLTYLIIATVLISFQSYGNGVQYINNLVDSNFNNYLIFKSSATLLLNGSDLYKLHPQYYYDLYKYSPTFALFMTPFSLLPNWLGLMLWNLLNLIIFFVGIKLLPGLSKRQQTLILLIVSFELIGSIMNEQSNVLMVGLMILSIAFFERKKFLWATLFLIISVFIKLFSIVLLMMIIVYPEKIKNILYLTFWTLILAILPIIIIGWEGLINSYLSWWNMLQNDFNNSIGFSVLGILSTWFNYNGSKFLVFVSGVFIMLLPLLKRQKFSKRSYRYSLFSAILIWIIIFNHKAESPTFIIAMTGIALYFVTQKFTLSNKILLVFCMLFISLVYSDIMPQKYRNEFFYPYFIKAFPCTIIWFKLIAEIVFEKLLMLINAVKKVLIYHYMNKKQILPYVLKNG